MRKREEKLTEVSYWSYAVNCVSQISTRKPLKIPKGLVDKRDRGLNPALPAYQFREHNRLAIGGAISLRKVYSLFEKTINKV